MSIEQAKQLDLFVCSECSSVDVKKPQPKLTESPVMNGKVQLVVYWSSSTIFSCIN